MNSRKLNFFRGKSLLHFLITKSKESKLRSYTNMFCWAFGIVRGYLPSVIFLGKLQIFPGDTYFQKFVFLMMNYSLVLFFRYQMRFILQSFIDYNRKIFLMKQLESLISTERTVFTKYLPNMNILDITTAQSWFKMRTIVKDYGYRMTVRHELLLPAIFIYMLVVYAYIWLTHFKIIKIKQTVNESLMPYLYTDFVVLTVLTLSQIYSIARVNWFYTFHIRRINRIKQLINDFRVFREHYFGDLSEDRFSMMKTQEDFIFSKELSDPVVSAYVSYITDIVPKKDIPGYLNELYNTYSIISNDL
jgi:hypothetical protein